jgi:fructoselysine 6-phosphate deglycase
MSEPKPEDRIPIDFDSQAFLAQFEGALAGLDEAARIGARIAGQGVKRLLLVGCGAPHFMLRVLGYWAQRAAATLDVRSYFSAELVHQDPIAVDDQTLAILGSHSGETAETVAAAEYLRKKPCTSIALTQKPTSPLGKLVDEVVSYGSSEQGYFSSYMLGQALLSGLLNELEAGWKLHDPVMAALPHLPSALAEAKTSNIPAAARQAKDLAQDSLLYVVGAGPMYTTAYTFASCFLMEMQRMHAHPIVAAEFFHGPLEIVDHSTRLLLLVGEDPSRPEAERVVRFCQEYARDYVVYDSRNLAMTGIPAQIRPIVSPFVVDAALTALVESLAVVRDHPLTLRRYLGKVAY